MLCHSYFIPRISCDCESVGSVKAGRQATGVVIVGFGCIAIFVLFHVENSIQ
jgi:hypothetical protein